MDDRSRSLWGQDEFPLDHGLDSALGTNVDADLAACAPLAVNVRPVVHQDDGFDGAYLDARVAAGAALDIYPYRLSI
jgi:hypothetical protein